MMFGANDNFRMMLAARRGARRRGTILITTMAICFALSAVVLVLTRKMSVEAMASANQAAQVQADAVELGAEEYVKGMLTYAKTNGTDYYSILDTTTYDDSYFAALQLGTQGNQSDGWFWIVRPVYDGEDDLPLFGLVDECSKLDINFPNGAQGATERPTQFTGSQSDNAWNTFQMLPGMTQEIAAAMVDWRDTDQDSENNIGAENDYYSSLTEPYYCKDQPYETVDELLMVRDFTREMLYGDGTSSPLGEYSPDTSSGGGPGGVDDPQAVRGLYDLLTVDSYSPGQQPNTQTFGMINVNTAPRAVLYCLSPFASDPSQADTLVAYREQNGINGGLNATDTSWVQMAGITADLTPYITGQSNRYSADIVAVSHDGRAFKRVRIVIDVTVSVTLADGTTSTTPTIISRHDITDQGWPMDPGVLASIRRGEGPPSEVGGSNNNVIGGAQR